MITARSLFWFVVDCVFPWPEPLPRGATGSADLRADCDQRLKTLPTVEKELETYLAESDARLEAEKARGQGVESRLTSIMGLSSIAGTIVFGSILALATGSIHVSQRSLRWIVAIGASYLTLQLCRAVFAAVTGLGRRSYSSESIPAILPENNESRTVYLQRRIGSKMGELLDLQEKNNSKVTQMAMAHRATENFVAALLIFALVASGYAFVTPTSNDIIDTLKKDHQLMEMIRGPQGISGAPGPEGPPGPKADCCKALSTLPKQRTHPPKTLQPKAKACPPS